MRLGLGLGFSSRWAWSGAAAPDALTVGQWTLTPQDGGLLVNISAATLNGGTLSAINYRVDGGSWVASGLTDIPAEFLIIGLDNGVEYDIEIQLVTNGGSSISDLKSETPGVAGADAFFDSTSITFDDTSHTFDEAA